MALVDAVRRHAAATPGAPALMNERGVLTYGDLYARISRLAGRLGALPHSRRPLVVLGSNAIPLVEVVYASLMSGRTCVIVDYRSPAAYVRQVATSVNAAGIALCGLATGRLEEAHALVAGPTACESGQDVCLLIASGAGGSDSLGEAADGPFLVLFTSGTTGAPKGLALSEPCILARLTSWTGVMDHSPADRFLCALPLSHLAGWEIHVLSALERGAAVWLAGGVIPNAVSLLNTLAAARISVLTATPALYSLLAKAAAAAPARFPLRRALCHSAPLHPALAGEVYRTMGVRLSNQYGSCETGPTHINLHAASAKPESVGRSWPEVSCEDESGRPFDASRDARGLFVRTPLLAQGTVDADGRLQRLDRQLAFEMRDIAAVDGDGDYFIAGRADDQINLRGYKMYPGEIEDVVRLAPGVVDCCAFATESAGTGRLHVAIETGSAVDLETVRVLCARMLPPYKRPAEFVTTRRLPRNRVGKVLRREVAAEFGEGR